MKLQQLKYLRAVVRNDLNISAAAERLFTSQPGISRQIRLLEEELGVEIFERGGRQLSRLTPAGQAIVAQVERLLVEAEAIGRVAGEFSDPDRGSLTVATSHTQARYVLPPIIEAIGRAYPRVRVQLHQAGPQQMLALVTEGAADFAIATEPLAAGDDFVMMPCYRWRFAVMVPRGHPLNGAPVSIEALSRYPIVTYVPGSQGRSLLDKAFSARALALKPVLAASDADVIKAYVRSGMGVGIAASLAWDPALDSDLVLLEAGAILPSGIAHIGFRKGRFLRRFHYEFMGLLAAHLTKELVDSTAKAHSAAARTRLFQDIELGVY
jgi:LysR family cys regulon transcriptional activator